jgi:hypothetical protein
MSKHKKALLIDILVLGRTKIIPLVGLFCLLKSFF